MRTVTLRGAALVVTLLCTLSGPALAQGSGLVTLQADPAQLANGGAGKIVWAAPSSAPAGTWTYQLNLDSSGSVKFVGPGTVSNIRWENRILGSIGYQVDVVAITADTACTFSGTVEFFDQNQTSLGTGTVEPCSVGVGSDPPENAPEQAGFTLGADDMCPDDGDPVNVTLESEDSSIVGYEVAVTIGGEITTTTVTGNSGTFQFNAAGQAGQFIPIVAAAKDAQGNVVGMRSLKPEVGKEGCDGQDGEDDTGNPWDGGGNDGGAEDKFNRCQADVDCWCRRILDNDSFWIVILKRAFVPCPCNDLHPETPMCAMRQHVGAFLEWGPFGLVAQIISLKDTEPGQKIPIGLPLFVFEGPGAQGAGITANGIAAMDFTMITGWSGWAWIRGLLGLTIYVAFAGYLMDRLQPKQVL